MNYILEVSYTYINKNNVKLNCDDFYVFSSIYECYDKIDYITYNYEINFHKIFKITSLEELK